MTTIGHARRFQWASILLGSLVLILTMSGAVQTRAADHRWRIEVFDRGIGIAPADLPRVFEPFITTRRTGSGLGLALARNILEGLGGSISVESQVDVGTTVRIEVPETSRDAHQ